MKLMSLYEVFKNVEGYIVPTMNPNTHKKVHENMDGWEDMLSHIIKDFGKCLKVPNPNNVDTLTTVQQEALAILKNARNEIDKILTAYDK